MYRDTFQLNAPIIKKETIDFHRGGMLQQWAEKITSFPPVEEAQVMQMACCEHGLKRTQGCSGVGTAFPHLFAPETLLEDLDFSFLFLHVAPGAV